MKRSLIIAIAILLTGLVACKKDDKVTELENPHVKLEKILPKKFKVGDTVCMIGKNFGNDRGSKYVEFYGWEIAQNGGYILWTDTLIKVVVPQITGSDEVNNGTAHINSRLSNGLEYKVDRGWFVDLLNWLALLSIAATFLYLYLKTNKIWKRKHLTEVAEAQSLTGLTILILNCFLWVMYYIYVVPDTKAWVDQAVYIIEGVIFFTIGTGIFIKGRKGFGIWRLIKNALKLERKEADYLLKQFLKPMHAEVILQILHQIALIDEEFDPKEQEIIKVFAKDWNIIYDYEKLEQERKQSSHDSFYQIQKTVTKYLEREPPAEQVAQLKDMVTTMIQADEKVTAEEELISTEIIPMLDGHLNKEKKAPKYEVLVVPQEAYHDVIMEEEFPNTIKVKKAGGMAYIIGSYYSPQFAEKMCSRYREMNLFTVVHSDDAVKDQEN